MFLNDKLVALQELMLLLPFIEPDQMVLVTEWLEDYHSAFDEEDDELRLTWEVNMNAQALQINLIYLSINESIVRAKLLSTMEVAEVSPQEISYFHRLECYAALEIRAWLQLSQEKQTIGWLYEGIMNIKDSLKFLGNEQVATTLEAWLVYYGVAEVFSTFGRDVIKEEAIFEFDLFGETTSEDISLYLDLLDTLAIDTLPMSLLEAIDEDEPEYTRVSLVVNANGVQQVGLFVSAPSTQLLQAVLVLLDNVAADLLEKAAAEIKGCVPSGIRFIKHIDKKMEAYLVY